MTEVCGEDLEHNRLYCEKNNMHLAHELDQYDAGCSVDSEPTLVHFLQLNQLPVRSFYIVHIIYIFSKYLYMLTLK